MDGAYVCLCSDLLHVWSVGRPADCSDCSSEDACGGAAFGTSRGLLVTPDHGSDISECVCQCTGTFTGLSCNVSSSQQLPVSPGGSVGITLAVIAAMGVVMACLLRGKMGQMSRERAERMLFIELADWALDWLTFGLAFFAADLQFDNDPDHVLRSFIMALCVLSTVSWLCELVLYCADKDEDKDMFCSLAQYFNFGHLLLEDGMQVVLYSIVASGNASSSAEDNSVQVGLVIAAGIQSLLFFFQKGYELLNDSGDVRII